MATILALALTTHERPVLDFYLKAMALVAIIGCIGAQIRLTLDKHGVAFVQILGKRFSTLTKENTAPPGRYLAIASLARGGQAEINHSGSIRCVFALRVAS